MFGERRMLLLVSKSDRRNREWGNKGSGELILVLSIQSVEGDTPNPSLRKAPGQATSPSFHSSPHPICLYPLGPPPPGSILDPPAPTVSPEEGPPELKSCKAALLRTISQLCVRAQEGLGNKEEPLELDSMGVNWIVETVTNSLQTPRWTP